MGTEITNTVRLHGRIRKWLGMRGFGFIAAAVDGADHFVHINQIVAGEPRHGARVTFAIGDVRGRTCAVNVVVLEDDGAALEEDR